MNNILEKKNINNFSLFRCQNHFSHHGIHWEFSHTPSQFSELSMVIQCSKSIQLFQSQHQCLVRRRVQKIEMDQIVDAQCFEHQHSVTQINSLDFWHRIFFQFVFVSPGCVETEALPCGNTPRSASALIG